MDFLVLGPLVVRHGRCDVDLGARRRERCLLGLLLLEPGRAIGIDRLTDLLWDGQPPVNARGILSSHVSRLRRLLDPDRSGHYGVRLCNRHDGYLVDVAPEKVDAYRFQELTNRARLLSDSSRRSGLLGEALALWRGPLLADVATDRLRQRVGPGLVELRLSAAEAKFEADLACGHHAAAVTTFAGLVGDHPFRERLAALFMLALYRCGQQTDALALFRSLRARLVEELGLEPGADLRAMHEAILRGDPSLDAPVRGVASLTTAYGPRPAQLPAPPHHFTGRDRELDELDRLLDDGDGVQVPIATVVGPAGVGKTALALRWAVNVCDRFPDGQLYLNLRGFSADQPVKPEDALGQLLRGLGVPVDRIPANVPEASAAYRTLLAHRRVLVVLDNAYDVGQVRPLLPGPSTCAVVVTSRKRLTGLTAMDGAHRIALQPLPLDEATALLCSVLGGVRVAAEPVAAAELADVCDRLPLALRIAAANLSDQPDARIDHHVRELRRGRLARLSVEDDPDSAVRAALDTSYLRLAPTVRHLFRLLAVSPAADLGLPAAAALVGATTRDAGQALTTLIETHLVDEPQPGRYTMHDLIRVYAIERLDGDEPAGQRQIAVERLLAWYLAVAEAVYRIAIRHREPPKLVLRYPPVELPVLSDRTTALAFLDGERAGLGAMIQLALDRNESRMAWQLAHMLSAYFQFRGDAPDSLAVYEQGLTAAHRDGNDRATATLHNSAGVANLILCRWQEALHHLSRARDVSRTVGDPDGEARALANLGRALDELGRFDDAMAAFRRVVELSTTLHQPDRIGRTWNNMAFIYLRHGQLAQALELANRSLDKHRELGDRNDEAIVLDTLGLIHLRQGDYETARRRFQEALIALRETGNRAKEGDTLANLAAAHQATGDLVAAVEHFRLAIRCHHQLNDLNRESLVHRQLAEVWLATNNLEAAAIELDAALALRRQAPDAVEEAKLRRLRCLALGDDLGRGF
ncbi:MAG: hypothetical protein V7603_2267 [Micromonosporaceae bacterium]